MHYWCTHIDGCRPDHTTAGTINPANAAPLAVGVAPPQSAVISSTLSSVYGLNCFVLPLCGAKSSLNTKGFYHIENKRNTHITRTWLQERPEPKLGGRNNAKRCEFPEAELGRAQQCEMSRVPRCRTLDTSLELGFKNDRCRTWAGATMQNIAISQATNLGSHNNTKCREFPGGHKMKLSITKRLLPHKTTWGKVMLEESQNLAPTVARPRLEQTGHQWAEARRSASVIPTHRVTLQRTSDRDHGRGLWTKGEIGWCNYVDHNDSKNRNR